MIAAPLARREVEIFDSPIPHRLQRRYPRILVGAGPLALVRWRSGQRGLCTWRYRGRLVDLTKKQSEILMALAEKPGRVIKYDEMAWIVWGCPYDAYLRNALQVNVGRLRHTLGLAPDELVETVERVGHRLNATN